MSLLTKPVNSVWRLAQTQGSSIKQNEFQKSYADMIKQIFGFKNKGLLSPHKLTQVTKGEKLARVLIRQNVNDGVFFRNIYQNVRTEVLHYTDGLENC